MTKRLLDIVASLSGIVLLSPVLLAAALWIKLDSKGPVFYRGRRVGSFGRPLRIFKFRTMVVNAESVGGSSTGDDDPRITRVGRLLRKTKLDELPQLVNVLRGEMSFVGPRPEVQQYVDMYTQEERAILALRPGITDWASIWNADEGAVLKGYPDPDKAFEELIQPTKLKLQLLYVGHHSLWIDLKIVFYTLWKLMRTDFLPPEIRGMVEPLTHVTCGAQSRDAPAAGYLSVTELPGHGATREQMQMLYTRYDWCAKLARGKDVLELACGPGVGLGYLARHSRSLVAGDYDRGMVDAAQRHYGSRVKVREIDAQHLPFAEATFDLIVLLEAIYYIPDPERFVAEARRVLRPDGMVLICSANRERPDFNASPFAHRYLSAIELRKLLLDGGFHVEVLGGFRIREQSIYGKVLRSIRWVAVKLRLIPKTMKGKLRLKRFLFGKLELIPEELQMDDSRCGELLPIQGSEPATQFKVIYAIGRRAA